MKRRRFFRLAALSTSILMLSGCVVSSNVQQIDRLESVGENPRIVMMPPDVKYYLLTASGVPEPNVEWTTAARENFRAAMTDYAASIGTDLVFVGSDSLSEDEIRYEALHSAVGSSLLNHHFGMMKLPSKNGKFDWSLGPDIASIGEDHDADYALFVYYRDYQASGGRVALAVLAAAVGAGVATGSEHGFASLVDLKSGDIVWFNVVNAGAGELRNKDGAVTAVRTLFKDIPTSRVRDAQQ
ncbi:MAG: hypothetical protein OEM50_03235 [Gammaproteobacteria bacterium]|nr:hypothetical protein [Gammaproteobacteria bacterium]MDH3362181.1 hypothetical protein [Gammaproteobacteria bacterium]MDH3480703.1 hypothetical protein [Gammaproteobacteria bacterium]